MPKLRFNGGDVHRVKLLETVVPKERSYGVLDSAIRIIATTKDPKVIGWMVKLAKGKSKKDWLKRTAIVEAFAKISSPEVDAVLENLIGKEKDSRVLAMALTVVGEKGLKELLDPVLEHLEHDDWQVRLAAIEALGSFGEDKAIIYLIDKYGMN